MKTATASPLGRPSARGSMWTDSARQPRWTRKPARAPSERSHGRPDRRRTSAKWVGATKGRRPGR
eukprot:6316896-Alexandrium_andersonii.AAC.1